MVDHSSMKLGKSEPKYDRRTLMLAKYTVALPEPPPQVDWSTKLTNLGIMGNDHLGDCTCAAIGHVVQTWTSQASSQVIIPDCEIISLYAKACGYVPGDPTTDQGGIELDVLNYWRKNPVVGHTLNAYCSIKPGDISDIQNGIWLFGGVYVGLALPVSAQRQEVWDLGSLAGDGEPGSWGGHAVAICGFDPTGLTCITWGALKRMSWPFWKTYGDESYALLSQDWIEANGDAPSTFDMDTLIADLANL